MRAGYRVVLGVVIVGLGIALTYREQAVPVTAQATAVATSGTGGVLIQEYSVPAGSGPHDVAPAPDGTVWYTAQRKGELGKSHVDRIVVRETEDPRRAVRGAAVVSQREAFEDGDGATRQRKAPCR